MSISAEKAAQLRVRNERIAAAYRSGEMQHQIAEREGISRSMVSVALKKTGARLDEDARLARIGSVRSCPKAIAKRAASNTIPLEKRFFVKCRFGEAPGDCWEWIGARAGNGRPQIVYKGRKIHASHAALIISGNPRIGNLHALHSCDNGNCVNPDHLRWGTAKDNYADAVKRGRAKPDGLRLSPNWIKHYQKMGAGS